MQHSFRRLVFFAANVLYSIVIIVSQSAQEWSFSYYIVSHSNGITWQKYHSPAISGFAFFFFSFWRHFSSVYFLKAMEVIFFCQRKEWVSLLIDSTCRSFRSALSHMLMSHICLHSLTQTRTTRTPVRRWIMKEHQVGEHTVLCHHYISSQIEKKKKSVRIPLYHSVWIEAKILWWGSKKAPAYFHTLPLLPVLSSKSEKNHSIHCSCKLFGCQRKSSFSNWFWYKGRKKIV